MLIGAMNNPSRGLAEQIQWIGESGLEFLDLTLEAPGAASWEIDALATRNLLDQYGLHVVGHTAPYLPIASPIEELRQGAITELRRCLEVFHAIGARCMNVHPGTAASDGRRFMVERTLQTLGEVLRYATECDVTLMVENGPGAFNSAAQLAELLDPLPQLALHLDIGHTNLMTACNTESEILEAHGRRVKHVHLHDNRGGSLDLHLPLGAGNIDIREAVGSLKASGYNSTITLEVFTNDPNHLLYSRDVLRRTWDEV